MGACYLILIPLFIFKYKIDFGGFEAGVLVDGGTVGSSSRCNGRIDEDSTGITVLRGAVKVDGIGSIEDTECQQAGSDAGHH